MESSTSHKGTGAMVAPEFGTWPIEGNVLANANSVRTHFDGLLQAIVPLFAKGNERYLSIVKTKLEEACFFAIKGIAKPAGGGN